MNRLILLLPLFLITMCGEAPVTPPAEACSPRLDGEPTFCPPWDGDVLPPKPKPVIIPKEEPKGEIDVWNPHHLINLQMMFERNKKIADVEKNATKPSDAINSALDNFWEKQDGSNGSTK
mgnify:CR=1 FL=1